LEGPLFAARGRAGGLHTAMRTETEQVPMHPRRLRISQAVRKEDWAGRGGLGRQQGHGAVRLSSEPRGDDGLILLGKEGLDHNGLVSPHTQTIRKKENERCSSL